MKIGDFEIEGPEVDEAVKKLLNDADQCKGLLLDVMKVADRNDYLVGMVKHVISVGDLMAEMIRVGRAQMAYDMWDSFRTEQSDDADPHS